MADGGRIRELRTRRGLLQRELAEMAGVTESAVRNYELGLRTPRPQHLEAIARALEVDPASLVDYGVDTARDALEVLFRLEEGFGARPEADAAGAPGRRGPRRARRPEARRGGQGVGGDAREAGLRGDLRGGVPRLEARVRWMIIMELLAYSAVRKTEAATFSRRLLNRATDRVDSR